MKLGAFSISLAVKDIAVSRAFYERLGFAVIAGEQEQNWLILRNEDGHTIGLFQGMFERNMLTFNPGWDASCNKLEDFLDVRQIQRRLIDQGIEPSTRADETTQGPAHCAFSDPDGNPILLDQHV